MLFVVDVVPVIRWLLTWLNARIRLAFDNRMHPLPCFFSYCRKLVLREECGGWIDWVDVSNRYGASEQSHCYVTALVLNDINVRTRLWYVNSRRLRFSPDANSRANFDRPRSRRSLGLLCSLDLVRSPRMIGQESWSLKGPSDVFCFWSRYRTAAYMQLIARPIRSANGGSTVGSNALQVANVRPALRLA